jgi:hypothetical protein
MIDRHRLAPDRSTTAISRAPIAQGRSTRTDRPPPIGHGLIGHARIDHAIDRHQSATN